MNGPARDDRTASLRHAETVAELVACFPVMRLLRPHLRDADEFVERVTRQRRESYRLLAAWRGAEPVALAGYRFQDNLLNGRHAFIDDLVTAAPSRGGGLGARLLDAVAAEARAQGCDKLRLGAAMDNFRGHRFYFRNRMLATGLSFVLDLD